MCSILGIAIVTRPGRWGRVLFAVVGLVAVVTAFPLGWLAVREPFTSAFMLRSHFADPATGHACPAIDYRFVPRLAMAPSVRRAILLAEDQRFLEHGGIDLKQVERVLAEGSHRGASTVTQQLAKNLFLWPGRSWIRKGFEAWYTLWLELVLSKQRILELYLNVAQFGPCVFGVEAAAQRYFGRPASDLTEAQSALLAAALPSPGKIRVDDPGPYAKERAREILRLMRQSRGAEFLRGV